jgi:hypothetical protein
MPSILNSDSGAVSGSAGLKFDAADDGILEIQNSGNTAITVASSGQATFTHAVSQPGSFMFRNKIINGNFDIWQRGTSQTTSDYGSADRWRCSNSGSTKTASQQEFTLGQTDVPGNPKYFMRHVVTSVAGAGNYVLLLQKVEDVNTLAGKTATLSFWARADSNKNIAVECTQDFGTGGSPSAFVTIDPQLVSLTTSWTKYTITVDVPSISGKTLGTNGNHCMNCHFWFDAGSTYAARSASLGQQSGTFDIAQVQLEEGSVATPFEQRPIAAEFNLCTRYFYRMGNGINNYLRYATGEARLSTEINGVFTLPNILRATPTFSISSASHFAVAEANVNRTVTSLGISTMPQNCNWIFFTAAVASGLTPGRAGQLISNNTQSSYMDFSAEL